MGRGEEIGEILWGEEGNRGDLFISYSCSVCSLGQARQVEALN